MSSELSFYSTWSGTSTCAASVARWAPRPPGVGRVTSVPQLIPLTGMAPAPDSTTGFALNGTKRRSESVFSGSPSRRKSGLDEESAWELYIPPKQNGRGRPGPLSTNDYSRDLLRTTGTDFHTYDDFRDSATMRQRGPAVPAFEDAWARGFRTAMPWKGMQKRDFTVYTDQVTAKLGQLVNRDRAFARFPEV